MALKNFKFKISLKENMADEEVPEKEEQRNEISASEEETNEAQQKNAQASESGENIAATEKESAENIFNVEETRTEEATEAELQLEEVEGEQIKVEGEDKEKESDDKTTQEEVAKTDSVVIERVASQEPIEEENQEGSGEGEVNFVTESKTDEALVPIGGVEETKDAAAALEQEKSLAPEDQMMFGPVETSSFISGDFGKVKGSALLDHKMASFGTDDSAEGEDEATISDVSEEASVIEEEVETPPIDRQPYLELYATLRKEQPLLKMKNNFLQKKMAEYFKRRKMEHVLRESDRIGDAEIKYQKKLDALWELRNINNLQRDGITSELNEMRATRNTQMNCVTKNFEQMLSREWDIGNGLIFTKTAKEIPEKLLERLLKSQRLKSKEIEEMRLAYIRIRDAVNEVQTKIKAMDKIGEHYTLIDYEQLKMENQNHADKIEERDGELSKLRTKYAAAIQCLAHFREKSINTDIEIYEMQEKLEDIELERNDWRERVNALKQERDGIRAEIMKLKESSGLLTKPKLLLDMEDTMNMVGVGMKELQDMKEQYASNTIVLKALKRNVENEKEKFQPDKLQKKERRRFAKAGSKLVYSGLEKFRITHFEEQLTLKK